MKTNMGVYVEVLLLYTVLFLSGVAGVSGAAYGMAGFSYTTELARILMYNLPSLALIWYLLLKVKSFQDWEIGLPNKNDALTGLISLPCLLLIGLIVAFAASLFGTSEEMALPSPSSALGWGILVISCISTGYLEESFFRFYILSRREELGLGNTSAIIFSTVIFSICHIYGGPWAFLNSFIAGIFLCLVFLRYRSLHGIALAHGIYNLAVYIINALSS